MNITYKLIKNRNGQTVVASELAKGHKNTIKSVMNIAILASLLSIGYAADNWTVEGHYDSAKFIYGDSSKPNKATGSSDINNNQTGTKVLNKDTNITFGNVTTEDIQPNLQRKSYTLDYLFKNGFIKIYDQNNLELSDVPTWDVLAFDKKKVVEWKQGDEIQTIEVEDLDESTIKQVGPNYSVDLLSSQPNIPYSDIAFAKINNGTMFINDTKNPLNVHFSYIKNSSLFRAENSGNIVVGGLSDTEKVKMSVKFTSAPSLTDALNTIAKDDEFKAGPTRVYAGDISTPLKFTYIDPETNQKISYTGDFTINNINDLKYYQQAILAGIQQNIVAKGDYQSLFNQAFKSVKSEDLPYDVKFKYDQSLQAQEFLFTDAMKAPTGILSIFKADGANTTLTFNNDIDIQAIGGHIAYGDNNAKIINNTNINLLGDMGNIAISNRAQYDNNDILVYGYVSKDGIATDDKIYSTLSDVVTTGARYINHNKMFIGSQNSTAVAVESDGTFINNTGAEMYIGSVSAPDYRSNGVSVNNANWENHGTIYLGKGIEKSAGILKNVDVYSNAKLVALSDLSIKDTNNAVYSYNVAQGNHIHNIGTINIGDRVTFTCGTGASMCAHIKNAVGINVENSNANHAIDSDILNTGTINVGGINSIGMRISGALGNSDSTGKFIGNTGTINVFGINSAGIVALKGAVVHNKGSIIVNDSGSGTGIDSYSMYGNYGIRAEENAKVYVDGPISLDGNNAIGVFARLGATVHMKNIASVGANNGKEHQIHYWISGRNIISGTTSSIIFDDTVGNPNQTNELVLKNNKSTIFRIDNGASFGESASGNNNQNFKFLVEGNDSIGMHISDAGTQVNANENLELEVTGENSIGLFVTNGAGTDLKNSSGGIELAGKVLLGKDAKIIVNGQNASAVVVDGKSYDLHGEPINNLERETIVISEADLSTNIAYNQGAIGYKLINKGTLEHKGNIDFTAGSNGNAVGIYIKGGVLDNQASAKVNVNGVGIDVYGQNSVIKNLGSVTAVDGIAAVRLNQGASLTVEGKNTGDFIKGEKNADAVLVHAGSTLITSNAQIAVDGKGAGIHFLNMDQDGPGQFKLSGSGTITVKGNDATGILVEGEDGNKQPIMGTSDFISDNSSGLVINVEDVGGNGITVNTSGKVHSGASVNIQSKQGQSALVLKGDTTQITQSGNLSSNSESSPVVELKDLTSTQDINFTNLGSIKVSNDATAPAGLVAINANIGKNINLTNGESGTSKGEIVGVVALGDQKNQVTLFGGSKADVITATAGETSIMLKDVQRSQSGNLFNKLTAGNGAKDSLELSATSNLPNKGSHYALTQAKADEIKGFEQLKIHANSIFELDNSDITLNESALNGGIHLEDATGTLFVNQSQATGKNTFNHNLYGNGVVKTDINGQEFTFNTSKANLIGEKFTGKLQLENAVFNLKNENTKALTNAILSIGQKAQTIVEDGIGKQNIGGLSFDNGRLTFDDLIPNMETIGQIADGSIHTKHLDLTNAKGTVDIHVGDINNTPTFDTDKPLLEQDTGESIIQLVSADKVTGISAGGLALDIYDVNGNLVPQTGTDIMNDIVQDMGQGKEKVANGKYGYGLQLFKNTNNIADGLHVAYLLKEVELLTKGHKALILHAAAGKIGDAADFSAKVTGTGDLAIVADSDYISLSNGANDYTGVTDVRKGHLKLEADGVLGHTSLLKLSGNTQVSLFGNFTNQQGVTQTVGAVQSTQNSLLNLGNQGKLTIQGQLANGDAQNSVIEGYIAGNTGAQLIFNGAHNTVLAQNLGLKAQIDINGATTVQTYHAQSLGVSGDVNLANNAILLLGNHDLNNTIFNKTLHGRGDVIITESLLNGQKTDSEVAFTADNTNFTGTLTVGQSTDSHKTKLTVFNDSTLGASDIVTVNLHGILNLQYGDHAQDWLVDRDIIGAGGLEKSGEGIAILTDKSAQYTGITTISKGKLIVGAFDKPLTLNSQLLNIENGGEFLGSGQIKGSVNNKGTFSIDRADGKNNYQYVVNGDFINQGTINLNTKYPNNNTAPTGNIGNKLVITGNYTANGGSIYLNTVLNKGKGNGFDETSTDSIQVDGNVLRRGYATQLFIQNYGGVGAATLPNAIEIISVGGHSDIGAFVLGKPATIGIYEYVLRKGQYDNNWYLSSNTDAPVIDPERKINPRVGAYLANMAMAFEMFNVTLHDRLGNPDYGQGFLTGDEDGISAWGRIVTVHKNYTAVDKRLNISGDYYVAQVGADLIKVAAENDAQYRFGVMAGYGNSDFTSTSRHTSSKADAKIDQAMSVGIYGTWYQPESWFVDTWIQYSHFKNEISMKNSTTSKYNSNLISASIELGYNHRTDDLSNGDHLILQPNAQVIYAHLSTKEYEDMDSGLRVASNKKNNVQTRLGMKVFYIPKDSNFRPYVESNWIYNSSDMGVNFNDKFTFASNAPKSRYEVKLGVEGELSKEWSLWGNVSYQFGKDKYKGYKAMLGAKYTW